MRWQVIWYIVLNECFFSIVSYWILITNISIIIVHKKILSLYYSESERQLIKYLYIIVLNIFVWCEKSSKCTYMYKYSSKCIISNAKFKNFPGRGLTAPVPGPLPSPRFNSGASRPRLRRFAPKSALRAQLFHLFCPPQLFLHVYAYAYI
jgi:hypothetical protein